MEVSGAGYSPEVHETLNKVLEKLLKKANEVIDGKLDEMEAMSLEKLIKEVRQVIRDTKGPNTTINAIQVPSQAQLPAEQDDRYKSINAAADDPSALEDLRKRADSFMERDAKEESSEDSE